MDMKRILNILFMALFAIAVHAEGMMHLLSGGYDAKMMTVEEMDSVLEQGVKNQ